MDIVREIEALYKNEKLSMQEVADRLGINMWRVRSLMRWHRIPRRHQSETKAIQFLKSPTSYIKKEHLTSKEKLLHYAGIMLYWGEGAKVGKFTVDLANSDPKILSLFMKMLREIYQIKEEKVRILLYCYSNQAVGEIISFWSQLLNVPESQFIRPYIRYYYDRHKAHKMPYGVAHIRYSDKRLFFDIKREIDIMYSNLVR